MKPILIFDFDGVIASNRDKALALLLRAYPMLTSGQFESLFSGNIFEEVKKLGDPAMPLEDLQREWAQVALSSGDRMMPVYGISAMLEALRKKYLLVINTQSTAPVVMQFLEKNNIAFFDMVLGSDTSRSKTEKFQMILGNYSVTSSSCVFITDTLGDVKDAQQVDMPYLVVTWGYQSRGVFEDAMIEGSCIVDSVEDLAAAISRHEFEVSV